jgi:hypothetical protein
MATRFGRDLGHVRVHSEGNANASARALRASAYTVDRHVVFAPGEFAPETPSGERLLIHELTHVVQARSATSAGVGSAPRTDTAEMEAERNARTSFMGQMPVVESTSAFRLQRQSDTGGDVNDPQPPRRVIYIDANVIEEELNRGNAAAAATLKQFLANADLRMAKWIYYELVERPRDPETRTANRLLIEETGIRVEPAYTSQGKRVDLRLKNEPKQVVSERDLQLVGAAAEAAASTKVEIWSFDKVFRNNPKGVTARFGVSVAPESNMARASTKVDKDYNVARALMGLPEIHISPTGEVRRGGGGPVGGSTPPTGPGGPGGGAGVVSPPGAATAAPEVQAGKVASDGTRAVVGSPVQPVIESGPSPRGVAVANAVVVGLQGVNFVLNTINDHIQGRRAQAALDAKGPAIELMRRQHPDHWILLVFFYQQPQPHPDSPIVPGPEFVHIEIASGVTRDEAQESWARAPAVRPARRGSDQVTEERWLPPIAPAPITSYRTPFEKVAIARFAGSARSLQNVSWGGITGFDDEDTTTWLLPLTWTPAFLVMRVPKTLEFRNGPIYESVSIPVIERGTASGGSLPAVDLDPIVPGDVAAVCVFPADERTATLFADAPATHDTLGQLNRYVNFSAARWVRPENIEVLQRL